MKTQKQLLNAPLWALTAFVLGSLACSLTNQAAATTNPPEQSVPTQESAPIQEPISRGNCHHPYYPVVQGATWEYEISGSATGTYTHSILSVGENEFTDQDVYAGGTTRTGQWKCDNGNLLTLTPGQAASVATGGQTFTFTVNSSNGSTLPADLNVGSTWSQEIAYGGTQDINGVEITSQNQATTSCMATGRESMTVPAGTFETMRVECNSTISIIISGTEPIEIVSSSVIWYAEGVGMVKTFGSASGIDTTFELKAYQIP